jgi:GT2 family glycosyltransferase
VAKMSVRQILDLSLVILSYNRREEIARQLTFLEQLLVTYDINVVIIDNNSDDGTQELLRTCLLDIIVHFNETNEGVAGGRNAANSFISRSFVLRIDEDTWLTKENLINLYNYMCENTNVGAMSPEILHAKTKRKQTPEPQPLDDIANYHGACHILRKDVLDRVGNIDPECDFGSEELDYSIRIKDKGFDIKHNKNITILHNNHIRKGLHGQWRKRRRLFNSVRLCYKYWPIFMSIRYSMRFLISHLKSGLANYGLRMTLLHCFDYFKAMSIGLGQKVNLDKSTIQYYQDPELLPDIGNASIIGKIRNALDK